MLCSRRQIVIVITYLYVVRSELVYELLDADCVGCNPFDLRPSKSGKYRVSLRGESLYSSDEESKDEDDEVGWVLFFRKKVVNF